MVPMSRENGAGVMRSKRTRRAVGGDGEGFGAVAAVDLDGVDAVAAFVQVGAVAGIPDHAVVAGLAEHLVVAGAAGQGVVAGAAEQQVVAALAEQDVVAGLAEELVVAGAAGQGVVAVAAEQLRRGQRAVGLVERDGVVAGQAEHLDEAVLATVAVPPRIVTAPPLTRMRPAASRLTTTLFLSASPKIDRIPLEEKLAVIAMLKYPCEKPLSVRLSHGSHGSPKVILQAGLSCSGDFLSSRM